jgi:hypothetical protein
MIVAVEFKTEKIKRRGKLGPTPPLDFSCASHPSACLTPIGLDSIRMWIQENRVNSQTQEMLRAEYILSKILFFFHHKQTNGISA